MEYCSIIWSPHQNYLIKDIERVQRRFLRLVGIRMGFNYLEVPLEDVASFLALPSLESRRRSQDIIFLYKLINGTMDCPELLEKINFRISTGTRSKSLFAHPTASTSYAANSTLMRLHRQGNLLPDHIDLFSISLTALKRALKHLQERV